MIMDWCWRSKDLNPWWDFDNGDEEEDGVEEDDNNINEEEDYVSDNELALVVQGSEPLVRFSHAITTIDIPTAPERPFPY